MNKIISIIIPIYNVQDYIDKCLEGVVNQEYKNIEIILIDDGSQDNSGAICDRWAEKDSRIVVVHQINKGVSAARNKGLDIARGEYIGFVDPDDMISNDMFSSMMKNMIENNADIVACGVKEVFLNDKERIYRENDKPIKLDKDKSISRALKFSDDIGGVVWDKLWKANIIKDIRFNESLSIAEDRLFVIKTLVNCNTFYRDFKPKYFCIKRETSVTQSNFSLKSFDIAWSAELVYIDILRYSKKYYKLGQLHIAVACIMVINSLINSNKINMYKVEYKKVISLLKKVSITKLPKDIGTGFRIKIAIIKNIPFLYTSLLKIKNRIIRREVKIEDRN